MFEAVQFSPVAGTKNSLRIQVLALSTCGFCKRGMDFLREHHFGFEFLYLDLVDPELKAQIKQQIKDTFQINLSYPLLIVDGRRYTVGYIQRHWERLLGLSTDEEIVEAESLE